MPTEDKRKIVLVTGFGPFGEHSVNVSWEAVKQLAKRYIEGVDVIIHQLPVEYETVKRDVPTLWDDIKPDLVVHIGVSDYVKEITLEQQAFNDGYETLDNLGSCPPSKCCVDNAEDCLISGLNMEKVCSDVNGTGTKVKAVVSYQDHPGRFLCDFSYFLSLHIDRSKSAFVHVPPLENPYTIDELAEGLELVIRSILKQI